MNVLRFVVSAWLLCLATRAAGDPCGMVPPAYLDDDQSSIARIGLQKTYVFFRDGIETFVIRPGFKGQAKDFGMLIPFPDPPAIRKVADDIFSHIEKAIDPPQVVVDLTPRRGLLSTSARCARPLDPPECGRRRRWR